MLEVAVGLYPAFVNIVAEIAFPPKMSKVMFRLCAVGQVVIFGGTW